jgi:hypothetical protein
MNRGERIARMVWDDPTPADLLTEAAFEERHHRRYGHRRSTNAIIHLVAWLTLRLQLDWQSSIGFAAHSRSGQYPPVRQFRWKTSTMPRLRALMAEIQDLLHLEPDRQRPDTGDNLAGAAVINPCYPVARNPLAACGSTAIPTATALMARSSRRLLRTPRCGIPGRLSYQEIRIRGAPGSRRSQRRREFGFGPAERRAIRWTGNA